MAVRIVPQSEEHRELVHAFNVRMRQGGSPWGWYEDARPSWLAPVDGKGLEELRSWREHYVALEDGKGVVGAYALKPQAFYLRGQVRRVADWQGPFSEGAVDGRYAMLGLRLLRDMEKREPYLFSWGHGGYDQPMLQMLRQLKWALVDTPVALRVLRARRFLQSARFLDLSSKARRLRDGMAILPGINAVGRMAAAALAAPRWANTRAMRGSACRVVDDIAECAEAVWDRAAPDYLFCAIRDGAAMARLAPPDGWPLCTRLSVRSTHGEAIGWALVSDRNMAEDPRFGDMRVGSIVDGFARLRDVDIVLAHAARFLEERGVDMILSNQAHPVWNAGLMKNGFLLAPRKRVFAASPALRRLMSPFDTVRQGMHLTNMDGHGPHGL